MEYLGITYDSVKLSSLIQYLKGELQDPGISFAGDGFFEVTDELRNKGVKLEGIGVSGLMQAIDHTNSSSYEFIGFAIGQKRITIIAGDSKHSHYIGLEPPFEPLTFVIYKRKLSSDSYEYRAEQITLNWEEIISLNINDQTNPPPNPNPIISNTYGDPNLYNCVERIQFMDDPSYDDFAFAFFSLANLENLLTFCTNKVILSGTLLEFGEGFHHYDKDKFFTLKMEADDLVNFMITISGGDVSRINLAEESVDTSNTDARMQAMPPSMDTGEPYFITGTPCPPHWDKHPG